MSLIDTYHMATGGQNFQDTYTLVSNGILIRVEVQPLPPIPIPSIKGGGTSQEWAHPYQKDKKKEIHRKKIIVTATIGGKEYVEEIIVEGKPELTAKDIKVEIVENLDKPQIGIIFS